MRNRKPRIENRESAFTLVELLVVVGIISLLIALAAGAYTSVIDSGKGRATRALLSRATGIAQEYQDTTGRIVNHYSPSAATNPNPYNLDGLAGYDWSNSWDFNTPGSTGEADLSTGGFRERSAERFVWATYQVPSAKQMYPRVNESALRDDPEDSPNHFLELRDAWGKKIVYAAFVAHQGHDGLHGDPEDATDTFTEDDFLPPHDRPFFASAGPDGEFGDYEALRNGANTAAARAAEDNLYSFDLESR